MNPVTIFLIVLVLIVIVIAGFIVRRRLPQRLDQTEFASSWKELQAFCKDKSTWPNALIAADQLLDKALKKRRTKGKTMGERMASASRLVSNNDGMWFAHNLYKKVADSPEARLKESDVKSALVGYRQALKDIGALESPASKIQDDTVEEKR